MLGSGGSTTELPKGTVSAHSQQGEKRQLLVKGPSHCSPQTQLSLLLLRSMFILVEMFPCVSTFALKQVETGAGFKTEEGKMVQQETHHLPRTSHPPASPRCTAHSHCKDSVLGFCSFAQVCSPLSDHQCTQVCKAHSDKIPERSKDKINQKLRAVSKEVHTVIVFPFTCTQWCLD